LMAKGLSGRMLMEHHDEAGVESARQILDKGDLRDYWMRISSARDFLDTTPSYTLIRDPILSLCHRLIACSIAGRSQAPGNRDRFILSERDGRWLGQCSLFVS
ncbi:hypothetical protein Tco_0219674, partial [Tanacetum coccineum]